MKPERSKPIKSDIGKNRGERKYNHLRYKLETLWEKHINPQQRKFTIFRLDLGEKMRDHLAERERESNTLIS